MKFLHVFFEKEFLMDFHFVAYQLLESDSIKIIMHVRRKYWQWTGNLGCEIRYSDYDAHGLSLIRLESETQSQWILCMSALVKCKR